MLWYAMVYYDVLLYHLSSILIILLLLIISRHFIRPLYSRILAVTNHHTGYDLKVYGQEGFTIIQYGVSDEYTPHCDGQCDGELYNTGGRIATSVLYCKVLPML